VGLHRLVIGATLASFRALPVGSLIAFQAYGGTFAALGGVLLETGLRLAMPVVAVLLMTQIALAFISRAAPQIQIFSIGFAVTLAVGGFVVFATLPDLGSELAVEMSRVEGRRRAPERDVSAWLKRTATTRPRKPPQSGGRRRGRKASFRARATPAAWRRASPS
jgi:flagellar biosynthetic protein FliR